MRLPTSFLVSIVVAFYIDIDMNPVTQVPFSVFVCHESNCKMRVLIRLLVGRHRALTVWTDMLSCSAQELALVCSEREIPIVVSYPATMACVGL